MPPSQCPVCRRIYCDHTCFERGQTYAQMMGDPPGTHAHRDKYNCLCDECTAPGTKPLTEGEWQDARRIELAVEVLHTQAIDAIHFGPLVADTSTGHATLLTEEGSSLDIMLLGKYMTPLAKSVVAYIGTEDQQLILWTKSRRKIPVWLHSICVTEAA